MKVFLVIWQILRLRMMDPVFYSTQISDISPFNRQQPCFTPCRCVGIPWPWRVIKAQTWTSSLRHLGPFSRDVTTQVIRQQVSQSDKSTNLLLMTSSKNLVSAHRDVTEDLSWRHIREARWSSDVTAFRELQDMTDHVMWRHRDEKLTVVRNDVTVMRKRHL